ncbi:hypothetical protein [Sphingomonas sanxanigenens]|uniref:Uncharacterized protein n=1 Tax=Sphingomonas sanxanigenens DSM 19645 = NX02 TaxID=1123269 RepID=W0AGG2_9SPHN|nr:hypothetical protein [Sphingomonas sanxanigenens]AHE56979.1 hypothetical protein NX02_26950 [Sphingomonas sanxanigenens DSM 19645 = NX02]
MSTPRAKRRDGRLGKVFAMPLLLCLTSLAALVVGLLDDGPFDVLCWLGLAAPVAAALWAWRARS